MNSTASSSPISKTNPGAMIGGRQSRVWLAVSCLLAILTVSQCRPRQQPPPESHVKSILEKITASKIALEKATTSDGKPLCGGEQCLFLTAWDFDGTILRGDCSEGLREGNRQIYKGLVQLGIENNLAPDFPSVSGFDKFWAEYTRLDETKGHFAAYTFLPRIFAGTPADKIHRLADRQMKEVYQNYFFRSSRFLIEKLAKIKIKTVILSASPHFFVRSAADTLPVPERDIHGIRLKKKDGVLTTQLDPPVTYADGKVEKLREVVAGYQKEGKRVFVLAAFGNSYHTDGPFLKFTASQKLPAGKPFSVMINGGNPPAEYTGLFTEVSQSVTTGN